LCLAALSLGACRRPAVEPRGELRGAWLREPELRQGFELREGGGLALLGCPERSGLAWNLTHGELVLSTNDARRVESQVARLRVAVLEPGRLELEGKDEPFAGMYRPARVSHVRGVVTYRERLALGPDTRVIVELTRPGAGAVALQAFLARAQVPLDFDLSVPAEVTAELELSARIADRERTLFATAEPVRVTPGAEPLELVLRPAP